MQSLEEAREKIQLGSFSKIQSLEGYPLRIKSYKIKLQTPKIMNTITNKAPMIIPRTSPISATPKSIGPQSCHRCYNGNCVKVEGAQYPL
jgi:hypothetical protein